MFCQTNHSPWRSSLSVWASSSRSQSRYLAPYPQNRKTERRNRRWFSGRLWWRSLVLSWPNIFKTSINFLHLNRFTCFVSSSRPASIWSASGRMPFRRSTSQCEPGRRKTSWYSSSHTDLCRTYNFNIISFHLLIFEPWNHGRIRIRTWRINNSRFLLWSAAEVARVCSSACQGPPACLSPCNFPGSLSKFCKQAKLTPRKRHRFLQETVWASKRRKEKTGVFF